MTDSEIIRMIRHHFEGLFPKVCPNCQRRFVNLAEYILGTQRVGPTISYDAELQDWKTTAPIGAVASSNCPCGSTLALTTDGLPLTQIHRVLLWIQIEGPKRGKTAAELIEGVRSEIRRQVLAEAVTDQREPRGNGPCGKNGGRPLCERPQDGGAM